MADIFAITGREITETQITIGKKKQRLIIIQITCKVQSISRRKNFNAGQIAWSLDLERLSHRLTTIGIESNNIQYGLKRSSILDQRVISSIELIVNREEIIKRLTKT